MSTPTYVAIATVTVTSATQAAIEFTSIPTTYTDLVVLASLRSTGTNGTGLVYFNNDTTNANYTTRRLFNGVSTAGSNNYSVPYGFYSVLSSHTSNTFSNNYLYIPNYLSSNNKSFSFDDVAENNATAANDIFTAGLWNNTAAITSIKIQQAVDAGYVQYSTATLYGILKQ